MSTSMLVRTVYNIHAGARILKKQHSDFLRLKKTLEKDFPNVLKQQSFPARRWFRSKVEPKFLGKRCQDLCKWFSSVLENENLRSHQALLGFLCLERLPVQHAGMNLEEAVRRTKNS